MSLDKDYAKMFKKYPDVVSSKDISQMLGIGLKQTYALINSGEIKALRCGNKFKAAKIEVIRYFAANAHNNTIK